MKTTHTEFSILSKHLYNIHFHCRGILVETGRRREEPAFNKFKSYSGKHAFSDGNQYTNFLNRSKVSNSKKWRFVSHLCRKFPPNYNRRQYTLIISYEYDHNLKIWRNQTFESFLKLTRYLFCTSFLEWREIIVFVQKCDSQHSGFRTILGFYYSKRVVFGNVYSLQ